MGHGALLLLLFLFIGAATVAHPMKWDQPLDGYATGKSSFEPAAYAVDWHDPPDSEAASNVVKKPEHDDVESSFEPAAYAVDWHDPHDSEAASDVAKKPEHGDAESSSFEPAAYAVDWHDPPDSEAASDVAKKPEHGDVESSLKPEAYPVKGDEKELSQPQGNLAAHPDSFTPSARKPGRKPYPKPAYPVKWDEKELSQPHAASDELHVEPGMLFLRKSLFPGAILPEGTKFAGGGNAASPAPRSFVSKAAADAIPFGYEQLDTILRIFRIPRGSEKADQIAETLRTCEAASPEPHTCATSREAATAFAAGALGTTEPRAVVTVVHGEEAAGARYAVAPNGVARIGGEAVVPCHPMPYPYMVHYCHRPADVEALRVELLAAAEGTATAAVTAVAMCHADTASWDARYFSMLNATRGEEICHFLPRNYVLWLPAADR